MRKILIYCLTVLFLTSCGNSSTQRKGGNEPSIDSATTVLTTSDIKPVVNVYIENSASMDGYVKGITEFELAVYNYLSNIKTSEITDTLNLFYINSKPIPYATNVDFDVISDFIEKLEPNEFRNRGGNRGTTDISNLFKNILSETGENDVAILVTDGIFSPGTGRDAVEYLINQQIGITNTMTEHLKKHPKTAVMVYQLTSNFNGKYFNREDRPETINASRPYYIWVIGDHTNIALLKAHIPDTKFKGGGVQHSYTLLPPYNKEIDYAILNSPKSGSFDRDKKSPKNSICKIKKASKGVHKGNFSFTTGMDLYTFSVLLGDEYLMNTDSYARLINKQPNNDYLIEIEHNTNPNTDYTHNMKLTTDKISVGELEIVLRNQFPQWIYDINDDEGLDIHKNDAINKTFGIKYLVEGIYEAYNPLESSIYATMKFNLKK